ncbi:TPA: hypothetical protein ACWWDF_002815 [Enterococcus faecium]
MTCFHPIVFMIVHFRMIDQLLFVTVSHPVENTRVYKRASSPLCFLCGCDPFSAQQPTEHTGENEQSNLKTKGA